MIRIFISSSTIKQMDKYVKPRALYLLIHALWSTLV